MPVPEEVPRPRFTEDDWVIMMKKFIRILVSHISVKNIFLKCRVIENILFLPLHLYLSTATFYSILVTLQGLQFAFLFRAYFQQ